MFNLAYFLRTDVKCIFFKQKNCLRQNILKDFCVSVKKVIKLPFVFKHARENINTTFKANKIFWLKKYDEEKKT